MTIKHYPNSNKLPIIDIGANLCHASLFDNIPGIIDRAQHSGIKHIVITGTDIESSQLAIQLSQQQPTLFSCTVGVHPHDAKTFSSVTYQQLKQLSQHPCVKAIGETGLDFNRNFSTREQQIFAFEKQIELAIECQLPLFLHERDAYSLQYDILKNYREQLKNAVIHCFTGSKEQCFRYLDLDLYIGITGWICDDRRGVHLREFIADIPINRLMIESDAPFLIPRVKPKPSIPSSSRNEPCTLTYVIEAISQHSNMSAELIAENTSHNASHFFSLGDPSITRPL